MLIVVARVAGVSYASLELLAGILRFWNLNLGMRALGLRASSSKT